MTQKSKGGRPPAEPHLQRINVPVRLPRWLVEWIDAQDDTRADVIEAALLKANKLKEPNVVVARMRGEGK